MRGYKEEGTTTTPFDMTVLNDLDRFHLVMDVIERTRCIDRACGPRFKRRDAGRAHAPQAYIEQHGEDMPEIRDWRWPG